jgi:hypothetical protein
MKKLLAIEIITITFLSLAPQAFAATADISQVQNFITNIIQVLVGLAGLTAAVFFVVGGFGYITSSGNPEHLDRSKRTVIYSGVGLAISLGAMVISNIVSQLAVSAFGK